MSPVRDHPFQRFFNALRPLPTFQWERFQQRDVLIVDHPACQAVFSRQGAQLLHFQPSGQRPWLWCSAQWPRVGAIRGGVPICWPWYGKHPSEGGWPAHGWARLLDWKLLASQERADGVSLHWRLQLCDWQVDLHARLGATLHLQLETQHQDSEPCQLSQGLLAYWRIGDVNDVAVGGLEGEGYDQLRRQPCRQRGEWQISGACQRRFPHQGPVQLHDRAWARGLHIDTAGSQHTGFWHPGKRPLLGVSGNESLGFVCHETTSGSEAAHHLAPGERVSMGLQARRLS